MTMEIIVGKIQGAPIILTSIDGGQGIVRR